MRPKAIRDSGMCGLFPFPLKRAMRKELPRYGRLYYAEAGAFGRISTSRVRIQERAGVDFRKLERRLWDIWQASS